MIISRIRLKNWKNFKKAGASLGERVFLIGPNAAGKSNFLDAFRFMRDIVKAGGGLQKAVRDRGGLKKIRCLYARREPDIELEFHFPESFGKKPVLKYKIAIKYEDKESQKPLIAGEEVWKDGKVILKRPDGKDLKDPWRLTQTSLEQAASNHEFREINRYFDSAKYFHIVPQLLQHPDLFHNSTVSREDDPYGHHFVEAILNTAADTRKARLKKIEDALRIAVPQLSGLSETRDSRGGAHLEAVYEHWRAGGAKQQEAQFSDGTIRLIAFLWSVLDANSLLLLEEPELSLNASIVRCIPHLLYQLTRENRKQLVISTHSPDLLADEGIGGEEILLLVPGNDGTEIKISSEVPEIRSLLESGLIPSDVIMPYTEPKGILNLRTFE
ncbi:MAG: AAA family ATPase [bacterium]|nr:AAA family ATPase [bacterium]